MAAQVAIDNSKGERGKPKYIPIDTIINLADAGNNLSEIAKIVNCHPSNISARLIQVDYNGLKTLREKKDKVFERLQWELAKSIEPDDIKRMAVRDRLMGIGILQDKIQALRGLPTDISLNVNVIKTLDDKAVEIRNALNALMSVDNSGNQPIVRDNVIEHEPVGQITQLNQATSDNNNYVNLRDNVTEHSKAEPMPRRRGRKAKGR